MQMPIYTMRSGDKTTTGFNRLMMMFIIAIVAMMSSLTTNAQLTGTKNIPGDYATLAAAIADLNTQGVGAGGVTLNLLAGNPETAPAGGYIIGDVGSAVLTSSSAANTVAITGNANTITAFSPQASGGIVDAVFKIIGADYITIQGFTLQENAANVTNTLASNDKTEFGVALFYATTLDGATNNTIQNNIISLSATYQNAIGIYSTTTHSASAPTTAAIATNNSGTNVNNKYYSNTISNVGNGILLQAGPVTATINEFGTDIGGTSLSTGNNITFGSSANADALWPGSIWTLAATAGSFGIQCRNVLNVNAQFNTVISNALTIAVAGISANISVTPIANVAYTNTVSNNNVTLTENGSVAITGIQQAYGNASATHICNSNIVNLTHSVSAANTAQANGIIHQVQFLSSTINSNTITINQSASAGANAGQVNGIQNLPAAAVLNNSQTISSNIITIKQATTGGTFTGTMLYIWANFGTNAVPIATGNINSNQFLTTGSTLRTSGTTYGVYHDFTYSSGITLNGNTMNIDKTGTGSVNVFFAGTAGSTTSISEQNNNITIAGSATAGQVIIFREGDGLGGNATQKTINGNTVNVNLPADVTTCFAFLCDFGGGTFSNNQLTFVTAGSVQLTNFAANSATVGATSGGFVIDNNTISVTSSLATAAVINGLVTTTLFQGSYTISNNTFTTLSLTGAGTNAPGITAISVGGGVTNNVFGNKIQGCSTGAGSGTATITGIAVSTGTTNNIFRNKIYDLSTSNSGVASLIRGISVTAGTSTNNIYNNTIGFTNALSNVNTADAIRAISISSASTNSTNNVSDNTIYLSSSSTGANFGTTGVFHAASATATTARLELRNNIIVNLSTPNGTGITSALRRSIAATYGNYSSTSDRNFLFAGTPGSTRAILNDNGTPIAFGAYQTAVAPRDANSFTDEGFAYATPGAFFISLTGSNADFLHIVAGTASRVESGGTPVNNPLITDDYDQQTRNVSTPDIGADEFAGTNIYPVFASVTVPTAGCIAASHAISADITVSTGTISTVTLNYNNGAPGSVSMLPPTGDTYSANIPAGTPGALVTWNITAVGSNGTSTTFNGTSYKDDPLSGLSITAVATPNPVCSGSPTSLSTSISNATSGQIGSGTLNNLTNTNIGAFYGTWWGNSRSQILFRASELNAAGIYAGSLTGLSVNITGGTVSTVKGFAIQIASTASTSLSAFTAGTFTTVYTNANYNPTLGVNTHTFSTPFVWDGTSNIIVDYCFGNLVTGSSSPTNTYTTTPFTSAVYFGADGAVTGCGALTGTASTIRPNLSFVYTPAITSISWSDGFTTVGTTNPLVVSPTVNTNYTASVVAASCNGTSNALLVTASVLPAAPGGNNSTQCGTQVPTAFVTSGGGGGVYRWYTAQTGGTLLQTGGSTYTTAISSTTHFWVSESDGTCESLRAEVIATVTAPDAIQASVDNNSVCLGGSIELSAVNIAPSPVNTYTYNWTASPQPGSGIPGGGEPGTPIIVTPTAAGTYTYTATAVDGSCTTLSTVVVTVKVLPVIVSATATPPAICIGSSSTLTAVTNQVIAGTGNVGEQSTTLGGVVGNPYRAGNGVGNQVRTQLLVNAADLTASGILAGNITSLAFTTTGIGGTMINFAIKIGATNTSVLTATFETPAFTTVFTQATFNPTVGLNTHVFQTPFNWNGTSNIVIDVCQTNSILGTTTVAAYTPSYLSNVQLAGLTTSCSGTAGTTVAVKPIMQFGGSINSTGPGTYNWVWTPGSLNGNSVSVSPINTTTYTVTATDAVTTCSSTATATVTVNLLPNAPSGANSEQCGTQIPDASVSSNSGAPVPVFNWYSAPVGGTLLQSSNSTTYNIAVSTTTDFYVAELGSNGCESPRTQVTVTVTPPNPVVAHATTVSLCENSSLDLSVTQDLTDNVYAFTWSATPAAGSGLPSPVPGSLATPVTVTPTIGGTYTYTVSGFDVDRGCSITSTVVVVVHFNPSAVTADASSLNICTGSTVDLTSSAQSNVGHAFTPYTTGFEGTFPPTGWTIINAGTGNNWVSNANFVTPPAAHSGTGAMAYGFNSTQSANTWAFTPGQPFIAGDTYTIGFWYNTASFGGAFPEKLKVTVGTNNTVAAQLAGTVLFDNNHLINETYAFFSTTYTATTTGTYYVAFNCYSDPDENVMLIDDVSIAGPTIEIPTFTWTSVPAGFTSNLQNPTGVVVTQTTTYTVVAHNSFGCVSDPVSVVVTALPVPNAPIGTNSSQCGLGVPTASVSTGGANGTFNWYSAQTGGTLLQTGGSTYTTAINSTTHFWVAESDGTCESLRTEVIVTVTQPDPVDALSDVSSLCLNASIQLSAVNTAPSPSNTYVYTWTASPAPGSGIPTNIVGTPVTITPTIAGAYTYTVTAFDVNGPGSGCTTSDIVVVTVKPLPVNLTAGSSSLSLCGDGTVDLTATGSPVYISEGFATVIPTGWAQQNLSTPVGTDPIWQQGIPAPDLFDAHSGATNSYALATFNNLAGAAGTISNWLFTPTTTIHNGDVLSFWTRTVDAPAFPDRLEVRMSTNGASVNVGATNTSVGDYTTLLLTVNPTLTASGYPNVWTQFTATISGLSADVSGRFAFRYFVTNAGPAGANSDNIGIDDVQFSAAPYSYSWSSNPAGFTSTQQNPVGVAITQTTTFTVTATTNLGCSSTSSVTVTHNDRPTGILSGGATYCGVQGPTDLSIAVTGTGPWSGTLSDGTPFSGSSSPITVSVNPASTTTYTITTLTDNGTGCSAIAADLSGSATVTINPVPSAPIANVVQPSCAVATGSITVTSPLGVDLTYSITGPFGPFQSSPSFPTVSPGTYTVFVQNSFNCVVPGASSITINPQPVSPTAPTVTGTVNVCPFLGTGDQLTYTASAAGATSYTWTLPPNVNLVTGGTPADNVVVTFNTGFSSQANKQIKVTASSVCGTSAQVIYYLLTQFPNTPNPITGPTNVCTLIGTANTATYTTNKSAGATGYSWTTPANTTVNHPNGTGVNDTTIVVTFVAGFSGGPVTVTATNGCGTSGTRSLAIANAIPSTPSPISGPTNACPHIAPTGVAATYSVTPVPFATSYTWTAPAGATVGHPNGAGANDYTVTVLYPAGFTTGTVTVSATNGCGTSGIRSLSITKLNPGTPSAIDVVQTRFCGDPLGRAYTYAIATMPTNATSIVWTVPVGATFINITPIKIEVTYPNTAVNGFVTAQATNVSCVSTTRSVEVKLPACPPPAFAGENNGNNGNAQTKGGIVTASSQRTMEVKIFPNPTVSDFKMEVLTARTEEINVRVLDNLGRVYKTFRVMPYQTIALGAELKAGSYLIEVRQGTVVKTTKVIKF